MTNKNGTISKSAVGTLIGEADRTLNEASNLVDSVKFFCRKHAFSDKEAPATEAALLGKVEALKAEAAKVKLAIEAHAEACE